MKNRFSCGGKNVYSAVVNAWNSVGYVGLCLVVVNGVAGCRSSESSKPNTRTNAGVTTAEATPEATSEEEVPVKTRQGSGKPAHGRPIQIVAGWNHICLRTDSDDVYCWGMNAGGEVGDGTINHSSPFDNVRRTPFHLGKITNLKTMALGHMLSLAIAGEGVIWVWGGTTHLEPLIDGKYKSHLVPERLNVAVRLQSLSTSGAHACGIDAKNQLFCWGTNDYGELGDGTDTARPVPQRVELPEPATYVSVSGNHSCAIVKSGAVYCWGLDPRGRPLEPVDKPDPFVPKHPPIDVGNARVLPAPPPHWTEDPNHPRPKMHADKKPVRIEGLENTVSIALGEAQSILPYACALGSDSIVRCWGANDRGQLADGTYVDRSTPLPIKDITDATSIDAAGSRACVIRKDKSLWCWGLRYGIDPVSPIPLKEKVTDVHDVALGGDFACAIHGDGIVSCWGYNGYSQLGNGGTDTSVAPVRVAF